MTQNINFFLPLRNSIEHRHMPQLDPEIAGHCQSMLINFETILIAEFSNYFSLNSSLSLALQFSTGRSTSTANALRSFHSAEYAGIKQYINKFHAGIPDEIMSGQNFALRVWLIPKPAKHARASDISVEYVSFDPNNPEQMDVLERSIVAVKSVVRVARNEEYLRPSDVSRVVAATIGKPFSASKHHYHAAKYHKVRPFGNIPDPLATNCEYCVYDRIFSCYLYTRKWADFLIAEYGDPAKYDILVGSRGTAS